MPAKRFSRRYTAKTPRSRALFQRARRSVPGGVESNIRFFKPHPIYGAYGEGGYLYDVDGNRILDFMMGYGSLILGHNNRDVAIAVIQQLESGSMLGVSTELTVEYAEAVCDAMPSVKKVRLTNSGTEATMHAVRAARAYTGKEKIAKAEGAYHGAHDYVLHSIDFGPTDARRFGDSHPAVPYGRGIPQSVADLTVVFPFNDWDATAELLEDGADELAAVLVEPVLCGPGVITPRRAYLKNLRRLTRRLGIVLIFDEVLTGFRLAYGGAQELYDVKPDLTCFGKVAGGGFPLGGFGGEAQIMDLLAPRSKPWRDGTYHAGTFNAHPVSLAAGLECLRILRTEDVYGHVNRLGRELFSGLQDLADDRKVPAWVEWEGSIGAIYFTKGEVRSYRDTLKANTRRWWNWFIYALGHDVLFGIPSVGERCSLSFEHTEEDVERALDVADLALHHIGKAAHRVPTRTQRRAAARNLAVANQMAAHREEGQEAYTG